MKYEIKIKTDDRVLVKQLYLLTQKRKHLVKNASNYSSLPNSISQSLRTLINKGYFNRPRTSNEITNKLMCKQTTLSSLLIRFMEYDLIKRKRNKNGIFQYSKKRK